MKKFPITVELMGDRGSAPRPTFNGKEAPAGESCYPLLVPASLNSGQLKKLTRSAKKMKDARKVGRPRGKKNETTDLIDKAARRYYEAGVQNKRLIARKIKLEFGVHREPRSVEAILRRLGLLSKNL